MTNCAGIPPTDVEKADAIKRVAAQKVLVTRNVYAAFFMGQFGLPFSLGVRLLQNNAANKGHATDLYGYTEVDRARVNINKYVQRNYKIALVGYSLGCTTVTYFQEFIPADLVCCIAESSLGANHKITLAKRSILFTGPDFLSDSGQHDGFTKVVQVPELHIPILAHLAMDFSSVVKNEILNELAKLKGN